MAKIREFEWDPEKSRRNAEKHGISFFEARALWRGRTVEKRVRSGSDISRHAVYGMIGGRHWTAIITYRNGAIRIISVRRSRKKERMEYDSLA